MRTTLNRREYEDFLIQVYFGPGCFDMPILACIDRAYRDFNRTLRLRNSPNAEELHREVRAWLAKEVEAFSRLSSAPTQEGFDTWHHTTCASLTERFSALELKFYAGQGQKWINMTFKYLFTLGDSRIPGFSAIYDYCHAPIDRIVVERLTPLGFSKLSRAWSRICYNEYFSAEEWIRKEFVIPPLDVEFRAWQKPDFDLRAAMRRQQT
jgi:hypothetical protein